MRNGDDIRGQAQALAGELRLIQVDFADASPEERRERLADRVGQALAEVHPSDRRPLLEALRDRFPVLGAGAPATVVVKKGVEEALLEDWRFLLRRLVALPLSEADRREAGAALRQAGVCPPVLAVPAPPPEPVRVPAAAPAWPEEAAREAVRDLGLAPTAELDPAGVLRALVALQDFAAKAEKALVESLDEMHPKSKGTRGVRFRERLKGAVTGGDAKALSDCVRALTRLQGAYIGGVKGGAPQAARDLHGALAPDQIEASVGGGVGVFGGGRPAKCWEEFKRRWELQSDDEIGERVRGAIGEAILTLIA